MLWSHSLASPSCLLSEDHFLGSHPWAVRAYEHSLPSLRSKVDQGRERVCGKGLWSLESEPRTPELFAMIRAGISVVILHIRLSCLIFRASARVLHMFTQSIFSFQLEHAQKRPVTFSHLQTGGTSISAGAWVHRSRPWTCRSLSVRLPFHRVGWKGRLRWSQWVPGSEESQCKTEANCCKRS